MEVVSSRWITNLWDTQVFLTSQILTRSMFVPDTGQLGGEKLAEEAHAVTTCLISLKEENDRIEILCSNVMLQLDEPVYTDT